MARCLPDGLLRQGKRGVDEHARKAGFVMLASRLPSMQSVDVIGDGCAAFLLLLVQRTIETTCITYAVGLDGVSWHINKDLAVVYERQ